MLNEKKRKETKMVNIADIPEIENNEEQHDEQFTISDASTADWAIEQIKQEQDRMELFEDVIKKKIEDLKNQLKEEKEKSVNSTSFLRHKLADYISNENVPSKETKTQISLKLPSGTVKVVKSKLKLVNDKANADELLEYCRESAKEFIKTEESVMWGELKKTLSIQMMGDSPVVINQDGEIVDCVKVEETLPEVVVK